MDAVDLEFKLGLFYRALLDGLPGLRAIDMEVTDARPLEMAVSIECDTEHAETIRKRLLDVRQVARVWIACFPVNHTLRHNPAITMHAGATHTTLKTTLGLPDQELTEE